MILILNILIIFKKERKKQQKYRSFIDKITNNNSNKKKKHIEKQTIKINSFKKPVTKLTHKKVFNVFNHLIL